MDGSKHKILNARKLNFEFNIFFCLYKAGQDLF